MTAIDMQMQIWRSNLELWRRMFDMQMTMAKGLMDVSAAWTWRSVEVVREVNEVERQVAGEVAEAVSVARESGAPAETANALTKPLEAARDVTDAAATATQDGAETAASATEEAAERGKDAADRSAEAAKPAAPKRGKTAAARRTTTKTASAPRSRKKRD